MYDPGRHERLIALPWDEWETCQAIEHIASDTYARFDRAQLWPTHPLDGAAATKTMLYFGAAGVIWALDYLARVGATRKIATFADTIADLIQRNRDEFKALPYPAAASYLMGDVALLLLAWRLSPSEEAADQLYERIRASLHQPVLELMWGTAGTMLVTLFMFEWTSAAKWEALFREQAERLWQEWQEDNAHNHLWTQTLYGTVARYLGPVHGFAGNVFALLRGRRLLSSERRQALYARTARALAATAVEDGRHANWPAVVGGPSFLVQYCHGAPGMVVSLADLAEDGDGPVKRLLLKGGQLIWDAGPLVKGPGLCHGTAGNGYALLKLYRRTGDRLWLGRARAFAMHAIQQCEQARRHYGRGRYSLWTGDLGLAIYLWHCINADGGFPSVDIF